MKKLFTLVLTLFILSSAAFSQPFISIKTPVISISFGHRYVETYSFTKYERDMQIAKKIIKEATKKQQRERSNKIQNLNDRFFDYRNKYNYNHYDQHFNWMR